MIFLCRISRILSSRPTWVHPLSQIMLKNRLLPQGAKGNPARRGLGGKFISHRHHQPQSPGRRPGWFPFVDARSTSSDGWLRNVRSCEPAQPSAVTVSNHRRVRFGWCRLCASCDCPLRSSSPKDLARPIVNRIRSASSFDLEQGRGKTSVEDTFRTVSRAGNQTRDQEAFRVLPR